jgi:hypothetical protein
MEWLTVSCACVAMVLSIFSVYASYKTCQYLRDIEDDL